MAWDYGRKGGREAMKHSLGEKIFDEFNVILMLLISFICFYPVYNLLVMSFNDAQDAMRGGIYFWPREFTLDNYIAVFKNDQLLQAFLITIARTLIGTATSVLATAMLAYGLSKKYLMFRKFYNILFMVTMFFSGGMIPSFLTIKAYHLIDSFWVYIIPSLISVWNMIIMRTFFMNLSQSVEEAAKIDGCSDFKIFWRVVLPLSKPVVATIALFNAVGQWNAWFDAYIYVNNQKLMPLQTILMKIINQNSASVEISKLMSNEVARNMSVSAESIKYATMMVATIPIVLVYPFVQKYFVNGIMIGSVKE